MTKNGISGGAMASAAGLDALERFDHAPALYGRSRESHALSMSLKRTAAGGAELMVLAGPAGIGKTSLVRQMQAPALRQRGYFVTGKFDQLQRDVPFSAIVAALHDLVRQLLTESEAQRRAWRDAIVAAVGRNGRVITEVVPSLERIVGPQPMLPTLETAETQHRFNLVFQNFLRVFCGDGRTLVIFLDDLQWADQASLRLITQLLSAPGTESLLVVVSCRDNEITATHPFMLAIKELERRMVPVTTLTLEPLGWADIVQLIGDSLRADSKVVAPLAEAIREKTGGNPFFIRQFLQKLRADGLLTFDIATQACRFDLAAIRAAQITENVADLIAQKISRLAKETQRIVSFGAAIGNRFTLPTLASVAACTLERAATLLAAAVRENLLVHPDETDRSQYAFQHDRVQHAAYALIPAHERPALNLAIGRTLWTAAGEDVSGVLFEIVNHMNQGIALIENRAERTRLARLNLLAANRARNSTAYDLATRASRSAIELLGWDAWGENYALAFEAHLRLAECQALIADFEGAFRTIDVAMPHVRGAADSGRLQATRTHTFLSMGDMTGAVACGREAARLFGLDLPEQPELVREQLQKEIGTIIAWSNEHGIESLLELPPMTDPDRLSLMSLLMHCIPPAYQVNPELFALICCKMVGLSIEHGNCPMSAKGYGSFAVILSGIVGNLRDGDRFGKLGVDLCARLNDETVRSACHFTWAAFASAWVRPIDESIEQFREGVRYGLQSGDHPHAAYCAARSVTHMVFRAAPLATVAEASTEALHLLERLGDVTNLSLLRSRRRFVDWLRNEGPRNSLDAGDFSEASVLKELQATSASKSMLSHFQTLRATQRYLAGEYAEAWDVSRQADPLLVYSTGMLTIAEHIFYQALIITALWNDASEQDRAEFALRIDAHLRQLKIWAESCPYNFECLYLTIKAEHARVLGDRQQAMELLERAIEHASAGKFAQIEALACELALKTCGPEDQERAATLRTRALAAYESWGAVRLGDALRAAPQPA